MINQMALPSGDDETKVIIFLGSGLHLQGVGAGSA